MWNWSCSPLWTHNTKGQHRLCIYFVYMSIVCLWEWVCLHFAKVNSLAAVDSWQFYKHWTHAAHGSLVCHLIWKISSKIWFQCRIQASDLSLPKQMYYSTPLAPEWLLHTFNRLGFSVEEHCRDQRQSKQRQQNKMYRVKEVLSYEYISVQTKSWYSCGGC